MVSRVSDVKAERGRTRRHTYAAFVLFALFAASPLFADIPDYKLGDTAAEDVITPVPLTVVNPDGTDALKKREANKVPPVFRFRAEAADDAEAALRASFHSARTNFDDAFYRTMKGKTEDERAVGTPLFKQAVESARRRSQGFPLLDQLAPVWARGESDDNTRDTLIALLREAMTRPVIAVKAPGLSAKNSVMLMPVENFTNAPILDAVEKQGRIVRGELVVLTAFQARAQVQSNLPPELKSAGRYLASFVRTNAMADTNLTQLLRARRTENLAELDTYEAAQPVIKRGQTIDRKALAALTVLREKSAITALQLKLATTEEKLASQPPVIIQATPPAPVPNNHLVVWVVSGFGVVVMLLLLILRKVRARPETMLPALAHAEIAEADWRERALAAEARAEQAKHAMKVGFMQWMRERLVQGLFHQRAQLLSSQQTAALEMKALAQRLEQLHAPLQERIAAYEKRIAELERELAAKGEENRELIKAKISLAKHQLTVERERGGGGNDRFGEN